MLGTVFKNFIGQNFHYLFFLFDQLKLTVNLKSRIEYPNSTEIARFSAECQDLVIYLFITESGNIIMCVWDETSLV